MAKATSGCRTFHCRHKTSQLLTPSLAATALGMMVVATSQLRLLLVGTTGSSVSSLLTSSTSAAVGLRRFSSTASRLVGSWNSRSRSWTVAAAGSTRTATAAKSLWCVPSSHLRFSSEAAVDGEEHSSSSGSNSAISSYQTVRRQKIRNVAVIAHVDHGKTSLVDQLLRAADKDAVATERLMDSGDLEKERGITITSKVTRISFQRDNGEAVTINCAGVCCF